MNGRCIGQELLGTRCSKGTYGNSAYCEKHQKDMKNRIPTLKMSGNQDIFETPRSRKSATPKENHDSDLPPFEPRPIRELYENVIKIGEGGFGKVYKAERKSDGKWIALKVIGIRGRSLENLKLFNKEVNLWKKISNCLDPKSNDCAVVQIYKCFYVGKYEYLYIEMELLPNGDMLDRSEATINKMESQGWNYNSPEFLQHMNQTCKEAIPLIYTLDRMHKSLKILHRDLKPENILFDGTHHRLLLSDFGLTCESNQCSGQSGTVGTLFYLDPRQNFGSFDLWGDVYSLGCTLYVMLTLQPYALNEKKVFDVDYRKRFYDDIVHNINEFLKLIPDETSDLYIMLISIIHMLCPYNVQIRPSLSSVIEALKRHDIKYLRHDPSDNFGTIK